MGAAGDDADDDLPQWSAEDAAALIGLPVRFEGTDDWVAVEPANHGLAVIIENGDGQRAAIGPVTVHVGDAVLLSPWPVNRPLLFRHSDSRTTLRDIDFALRRMRLVGGLSVK